MYENLRQCVHYWSGHCPSFWPPWCCAPRCWRTRPPGLGHTCRMRERPQCAGQPPYRWWQSQCQSGTAWCRRTTEMIHMNTSLVFKEAVSLDCTHGESVILPGILTTAGVSVAPFELSWRRGRGRSWSRCWSRGSEQNTVDYRGGEGNSENQENLICTNRQLKI